MPPGRLHPAWWAGVACLLLWLDYATGLDTQFPILYFIPVTLAAWYSGRWPALALAIGMPLVHIVFLLTLRTPPEGFLGLVAMTIARGAVIIVTALWFARLSKHERDLRRHVETLEGLLPICAFCKNIRTDGGDWERLETFISKRSTAQFSHGFCPTCAKTHYSNYLDDDTSPTAGVSEGPNLPS